MCCVTPCVLRRTCSGSYLGTIVGNGISPVVLNQWGWRAVFVWAGGMCVIWTAVRALLFAAPPDDAHSSA